MTSNFLKEENLKLLWDVISDEDILKFQPKNYQEKIFQIFLINAKGFYELESKKPNNLVDMNKKYILLLLHHIKNTAINPSPNKIKILDEIPKIQAEKELITYEEIQNDKRSQFEKDLSKRQEEFSNFMKIDVPLAPDFTDKFSDSPISEMEKEIRDITAQRNYEIEEINRNHVFQKPENWLKPQETSLKSEKGTIMSQHNNDISKNNTKNAIKKNVTWKENEIIKESIKESIEKIEIEDNNILKRLKKENTNTDTDSKINDLQNEVKNINEKINMILDLLQNKLN